VPVTVEVAMTRTLWLALSTGLLAGMTTVAQYATPRGEVVFADRTRVAVEIADTDELRQRGLMFRETLAPNEGMVFIFPETGDYPFWMKNTLIPLDMIWVDASRRVVAIAHSVPPCKADPCPSYPPNARSLYVVEVVAGFAKSHAVVVGDQLAFSNIGRARGAR
jgi:uncharacterized membrane protein (UPF0127 family)